MNRLIVLCFVLLWISGVHAQQYLGLSGLIHTPSAEMDNAGDARIGGHYLNYHSMPKESFGDPDKPYNTGSFYLSLTPFSWIQGSYSIVLLKDSKGLYDPNSYGYYRKDEAISLKVRPLMEGKYWPAIAFGATDIYTRAGNGQSTGRNQYFGNYYIAATKNLSCPTMTISATLAYRKYIKNYNRRWNGVVGGITYRPSFLKEARAIVEWTGNEANFGIDCLLFRHLLIQASMLDGRYFSGGLCYTVNLF